MDGTLAAIFAIASLADMGINYCPQGGCLQYGSATPRLFAEGSQVRFQDEAIGNELYLGYDLDYLRGPYQPTLGLSMTDEGASWIGMGVKSTWWIGGTNFFAEGSLMPGFYYEGDGPDLGSGLEFRSALGGGYEFRNGATLSVLYDHRSNAELGDSNPGLETVGLRVGIPLN